jgi:hypothetical protein
MAIADQVKLRAQGVGFLLAALLWPSAALSADPAPAHHFEFSGSIVKQVKGKKYQAQVFAKGARLRIEYKYAILTEYGYAAVEIIRLDLSEAWYVLAQRKELLVVPLDREEVLPLAPSLPGERSRTLIGDAIVLGRPADLYEVHTERQRRMEQWYEWVDRDMGVVMKLVSRDRDWSFAYERIRWSPQRDEYFKEPPGYRKRPLSSPQGQEG